MTDAPAIFTPTAHPVIGLLPPGLASLDDLSAAELAEWVQVREAAIAQELSEPINFGWEPPIWTVCDAILGLPTERTEEAAALRAHLGFEHPADVLLILGVQRGSKSQYAANRSARLLQAFPKRRAWAFHSTLDMSIEYQQPLFWHYFHSELKKEDIRGRRGWIIYTEKNGFTKESFILPNNGSRCKFKSYNAEMEDAIEGGEVDMIWFDELVPADWVKTAELRIATRGGKMIITFTPVEGYTDTVAMFLDGARIVKEGVGYVLPKDGGAPEPWRALGLEPFEYEHLLEVARQNELNRTNDAALYPQSRPEDWKTWLAEGKRGEGEKEMALLPLLSSAPQREFERVPRVMKCADPKRAVVFFNPSDNPFGNPKKVWSTIQSGSVEFIKERFYGIAHKTVGAAFKTFDWNIHTIPAEQVPAAGTNYQLVDPHGIARNYAMLWVRCTPEHDYVYREFPGGYYVPDQGVPGPWATAGNQKHPDGNKGPGQRSFGWGHLQYKKEIARLEQWPQFKAEAKDEEIALWDQWANRPEMMFERAMDSRFAGVPKPSASQSQTPERPVTLLTEFDDIGLTFQPTPGDSVNEGVHDIEAALFFHARQPVSFHNQPRLLISRACVNTIFALQIWTGEEKDRGATAEWIGLLRYFYRARYGYQGLREPEEENENDQWHEPAEHRPARSFAAGF